MDGPAGTVRAIELTPDGAIGVFVIFTDDRDRVRRLPLDGAVRLVAQP